MYMYIITLLFVLFDMRIMKSDNYFDKRALTKQQQFVYRTHVYKTRIISIYIPESQSTSNYTCIKN